MSSQNVFDVNNRRESIVRMSRVENVAGKHVFTRTDCVKVCGFFGNIFKAARLVHNFTADIIAPKRARYAATHQQPTASDECKPIEESNVCG
jgi:hypothetical protein